MITASGLWQQPSSHTSHPPTPRSLLTITCVSPTQHLEGPQSSVTASGAGVRPAISYLGTNSRAPTGKVCTAIRPGLRHGRLHIQGDQDKRVMLIQATRHRHCHSNALSDGECQTAYPCPGGVAMRDPQSPRGTVGSYCTHSAAA